jgi:hypothetical protein
MTTPDNATAAEERARLRYGIMNAARFGGIALVMLGIAIAREVVPLPYALGVALAVGGMLGFFFVPRSLARRWKAADRAQQGDEAP